MYHIVCKLINLNFQTFIALSNQIIVMSMSASHETSVNILFINVPVFNDFGVIYNFKLVKKSIYLLNNVKLIVTHHLSLTKKPLFINEHHNLDNIHMYYTYSNNYI